MAEKYNATATVIDGILILSLPDAIPPVVWQMELGQSKSSALEIRDTTDGKFILTLKTPRQDVLDIATYANRDQAIKTLLVTSSALEKAQGQLKAGMLPPNNAYPVPAISYTKNKSGFLCVLKKILSAAGIIFGAVVFIALVLFVVGKLFLSAPSPTTAANTNAPISADEFLDNR